MASDSDLEVLRAVYAEWARGDYSRGKFVCFELVWDRDAALESAGVRSTG